MQTMPSHMSKTGKIGEFHWICNRCERESKPLATFFILAEEANRHICEGTIPKIDLRFCQAAQNVLDWVLEIDTELTDSYPWLDTINHKTKSGQYGYRVITDYWRALKSEDNA